MSKLTVVLKFPLRLLLLAVFCASYYAAYTNLVGWQVPIVNTIIIGLYLLGVALDRKPKDAVPNYPTTNIEKPREVQITNEPSQI